MGVDRKHWLAAASHLLQLLCTCHFQGNHGSEDTGSEKEKDCSGELNTRTISSSSFRLLMWMWSLLRQKCRWSSLICSAPMNWSHALLLSVMQIFGGSILSRPSIFLGWWIMRWGLWLHSAALIAVSSCSPGWSWPNQSPGPSSQMVIWMTCCCYLFHLLHQTFHLLVRRSSIKFHIDWFRIVNFVFYSNKCISGVWPPQLWLFFLLHSRFKRLATPALEDSIKEEISNELRINQTIKSKLTIKVIFLLESGEIVYPYFHGEIEILFWIHNFEDFCNSQKVSIIHVNKIQSCINKSSVQKFLGIEYIDIHLYRITPLNWSLYFESLFMRNSNIINIQNNEW